MHESCGFQGLPLALRDEVNDVSGNAPGANPSVDPLCLGAHQTGRCDAQSNGSSLKLDAAHLSAWPKAVGWPFLVAPRGQAARWEEKRTGEARGI